MNTDIKDKNKKQQRAVSKHEINHPNHDGHISFLLKYQAQQKRLCQEKMALMLVKYAFFPAAKFNIYTVTSETKDNINVTVKSTTARG